MTNYPPGRVDEVWKKCKGRCWICGEQVGFYGGTLPDAGTLDHIVPRAHGGRSTLKNLRLAHRRCNAERGAPKPQPRARREETSPATLLAEAIKRAGAAP